MMREAGWWMHGLLTGKYCNDDNYNNLRDMESFVTQETHLFHDSIRFYYDGSGANRKNCTCVCVAVSYSLFYIWCEEL